MKKFLLGTSFIAALCANNLFSQTANAENTLTFHIIGFEDNAGQALLKLFRKEDKVPTIPFMLLKSKIINNQADFSIESLPYGEYAAIVVHDENANGEIDHSFGIPSEPLGFTNNWELTLFSGMPTFEKLKFVYSKTSNFFTINLDN
jgi:uncharacterized protein (DUF2141 family)